LNIHSNKVALSISAKQALCAAFRQFHKLFIFALLSSFAGAANSSTVHKCLQPDGHYEFTDKKCVAPEPTFPQEQAVSAVVSASSEVKHTDAPASAVVAQPHATLPVHSPQEALPKQTSPTNSTNVPSLPANSAKPNT
jgi:hypothetical protein